MARVYLTKKAKDNTFDNCDFENVDFENEGERNRVKDSRFKGPAKGLEIYARNIKNAGALSSDSYAKIVAENYEGAGKVSVAARNSRSKPWHEKWWGVAIIGLGVTLVGGILVNYF